MTKADEAGTPEKVVNYVIEGDKVRLRASRCSACGSVFHPPRTICPADGASPLEETLLGDEGTVYTFTVVRQSTPEFRVPYVLVYVDFPEQVRVLMPYDGEEPPPIGSRVNVVMGFGPKQEEGDLVNIPHARLQ
ncbi:MAG: Zn-ribbon domain-containing OB-fold protein [Acidimicrobiales bacterium]